MKSLFYSFIVLLICSCQSYNKDVIEALSYSGDNRSELISVLKHYRTVDKNKEKYKAAEYLIANMTLHRSYPTELYKKYADSLDSLFTSEYIPNELVKKTKEISDRFRPEMKPTLDIRTITSGYLIRNIDYSFKMWEESSFLYHLNFDEFCEYVLPYKCIDLQPVSNWKEEYSTKYRGSIDLMSQLHDLRFNSRKAVEVLQNAMSDNVFTGTRNVDCIELVDFKALENIQVGTCYERSILGMLQCRSKGVPVSLDMVPNWGDRQDPHFWNNVNMENNNNIPYSPFTYNPGDANNLDRVYAKVYRYTYKHDPVLYEALKTEGYLPPLFSNPFIKDVTTEYAKTKDISVKINHNNKSKFAYLCVFNKDWQPVAATKIHGHKACFNNVGLGVLYLVVSYDDGNVVPISKPIFVDVKGNMSEIKADKSVKETVHITRKYPAFRHIFKICDKLGSFSMLSSNHPYDDYTLVGNTPKDELFSGVLYPNKANENRYWKLSHEGVDTCFLAEIYFHEAITDTLIIPVILKECNDLYGNPSANLMDSKLLTYYAVQEGAEDVVFDFHRPVSIGRITYIKRGDGNNIRHGDEYELSYWEDGWVLVGEQVARDISLDFKDVPKGALLYIKCTNRGRQNRIFTYNDEPRWY